MGRGVNKTYRAQTVAIFLWSYHTKTVTDEFRRALLGVRGVTDRRTGAPVIYLVSWAELVH